MVKSHMFLKEYLKTNNIHSADFAERIGVSKGGVHKWISGERFPRPSVIARIQSETDGEVTANDFAAQQIQQQKDSH